MNLFDMRTIIFSYVLSNAVCAIVMALLWVRNRRRFAGLGFWLADFAIQFTALLLIALRGKVPDFLSIVVSNGLVILGTILLYIGLQRFVGRRSSQLHNYILLIVFILIHAYFTFVRPSLLVRNINLSVGIILLCAQCAWLLMRRVDVDMRRITSGIGYIFLAFCLASLARILVDLVVDPGNDFFKSDTFEALATLTNQMLFVTLTFGLLLMLNWRLVGDLEEDFLELKQADEAIQHNEKRYRSYIEVTGQLGWTTNADGEVQEDIPSWRKYTGQSAAEVSGWGWSQALHPDDVDHAVRVWRNAVATQTNYEVEYRIRRHDGVYRHFLARSVPIHELTGEIQEWVGTCIDITERKQSEAEISSLSKFPTENPNPVLRVRKDGRVMYANAASRELLEMWGCDVGSYLSGELKELVDAAGCTGSGMTVDVPCNDKVYSIMLVPIAEAGYLNLYASDISARKHAEEQLRYQAAVLSSVNDAVVASDAQFCITVWNPSAESLYGWKAEEVLGRHGLEVVRTEWPKQDSDAMRRAIGEVGRWRGEATQVRKDGSRFPVEISSIVLYDENKHITGYVSVNRDITARLRAEQALLESEEKYRLLADHATDWIYWIRPDRTFRYISPSCERVTGFAPRELMDDPHLFTIMVHPEDRSRVGSHLGDVQEGAETHDLDFRIITKTNEVRWISHSCEAVYSADGKYMGRNGTNRDITERKRAEEAMLESKTRLDAALESMTDAVFISDAEGRFIEFNEAFATFHKFRNKDECAKTLLEYPVFLDVFMATGELAPLEQWAVPRALRGETGTNVEYGLRRKDTDESWVGSYSFAPIRDDAGAIVGSVVVGRDISRQKQAEEQRAMLANRLGLATRAAHMGIWDWDIQKNELVWDDQMYALYGLKPGEFGGAYEAWLNGVHPDDREPTNEASSRAVRGEAEYDAEFRIIRPDGSVHWLKANGEVFRDELGRPLRMVGVNYDITERKQSEAALQQSEERLRLSLQAANQGLYDLNVQTGATIVNDEYVQMLGYDPETFIETNAAWIERLHPDDKAITSKAYQEYIAGLLPEYRVEFRQKTKDGNWKWILSLGKVVEYDPQGKPLRMLGTHTDITKRKQVEEALRKKEAEFRSLYDSMTELFVLHEVIYDVSGKALDYRILECNPAFEKITGIEHDSAVGSLASVIYGTGEAPYLEPYARVAESGDPIQFETEFSPMNKHFHISVFSPERGRFATLASDITDRKQADFQRQFFYDTLNASQNEIYMFDATNLQFEFVSRGALTNLGYSLDQILQMTPLDIKPDFTLDSFENLMAPLRRREVQVVNFEARHRRADGSLYPVDVHLQLFDQAGRQVFLAIILDTTERKEAEAELSRMMEELKHSNAELEEFAYVASHDLQEPLRGIAGLVQLLQHRYQDKLDSRADEYIDHIVDGTKRMQMLINDLLAYSRIGRHRESIQSIEVDAALKAAMKNLSAAIQEGNANITSESLPKVKADTTQLTQVFQNLIGNALKFQREITPEIHIGISDAGEFWQFSVRDNGIGIETQYYDRIFQVFQRLHTRREYKGTGIGLAICKKIVERHGGRIWVESQLGQGSTLYFTLPKG